MTTPVIHFLRLMRELGTTSEVGNLLRYRVYTATPPSVTTDAITAVPARNAHSSSFGRQFTFQDGLKPIREVVTRGLVLGRNEFDHVSPQLETHQLNNEVFGLKARRQRAQSQKS